MKYLCFVLLILTSCKVAMGQKSFNLNIEKSFSEEEDAFAYISRYFYNNPEEDIKQADLVLYKIEDPVTFAKTNIAHRNFSMFANDSILQELPIEKTWTQ
ncbi:unnamed protein product, partial [Scytosiphon promiscuus]